VSVLLGAAVARAEEQHLAVEGAWIRFILPSLPAAGYFTLANGGDQARILVGAESPACGSLTLHRTIGEGGTERMEMEKNVVVPAHGKVAFAPGGLHLMCVAPSAELHPGASVPVSLRFADGAALTARFSVRRAAGR
jgi:copper(I)-binding protein